MAIRGVDSSDEIMFCVWEFGRLLLMTYEESVKTVPSCLKSKSKNTKSIGPGYEWCVKMAQIRSFLQLKVRSENTKLIGLRYLTFPAVIM